MSYPYAEEYASRFMTIGLSRGWLVWAANALRAVAAKPLFYGWVARRADHLFVQSDAMRSFMVDKGVAPHRMTAVPMAVDVQTLAAVERPVPQPQRLVGRRVIAYLGQLSRYRQSDFLLEVVAELRKNFPDILLLLVGDGASVDEKDWLRRRIDELGVHDCVWLTGWLPQEQALPLVRCAQVGLSPIPRGPLFDVSSPTKAVEYLALSIPCVANDIPDQRFVLESSGGGVCVPMTVRDFVDAVAGLLADPARAAGLGDAGRRWVLEHRSYHHIAQSVAQAYAGLADRRTGATSTRVVF
jgi:glycosyltransferase involved in cell wall biosynthesis